MLKSSQAISCFNAELKTNISEISSISITITQGNINPDDGDGEAL
jgi:hypothetical protein